jgi:class III cytochrome C family protein
MKRGKDVPAGGAALLMSALWTTVALAACAGSRPVPPAAAAPAQATHPEVDTGLATCAECHAQATPAVEAQWQASRHGISLVSCVVCHGSTGADFRGRPAPVGCAGCHPEEAAAATSGGAPARCFECHPPHALAAKGTSPHPAQDHRS